MLFQLSEHSSPGERGRGGTRGRGRSRDGRWRQGWDMVSVVHGVACLGWDTVAGRGWGGERDVASPVEWDVWEGRRWQGGDGVSHKEGGGREGTRVPAGRVTPRGGPRVGRALPGSSGCRCPAQPSLPGAADTEDENLPYQVSAGRDPRHSPAPPARVPRGGYQGPAPAPGAYRLLPGTGTRRRGRGRGMGTWSRARLGSLAAVQTSA